MDSHWGMFELPRGLFVVKFYLFRKVTKKEMILFKKNEDGTIVLFSLRPLATFILKATTHVFPEDLESFKWWFIQQSRNENCVLGKLALQNKIRYLRIHKLRKQNKIKLLLKNRKHIFNLRSWRSCPSNAFTNNSRFK